MAAVAAPALQSRMLQVDKRPLIEAALTTMPRALIDIMGAYANETQSGLYGPEAWTRLRNIVIIDNVPPAPSGDFRGKILLYIPLRISIDDGEEQMFTLRVLEGVFPSLFSYFDPAVRDQLGDTTAAGWVILDKAVIEGSRGKSSMDCQKMVEARGPRHRLQRAMETISLIGLVFEYTGEKLFGRDPMTFNFCEEKISRNYHVLIGGFGPDGLDVSGDSRGFAHNCDGAACAQMP